MTYIVKTWIQATMESGRWVETFRSGDKEAAEKYCQLIDWHEHRIEEMEDTQ